MKILIVSKIATHPMDAGNKHAILAQAKILKDKGNDVHFLYVYEKPLDRNKKRAYEEDLKQTREFWKDKFHVYQVNLAVKIYLATLKQIRKHLCHRHFKVDDQYPFGLGNYVNRLNDEYHFDACIINYFYLSRLFNKINIPKKAIYTHDCMAYKDIKFGMPYFCTDANTEAKSMQRCPHIFAIQGIEADYFQMLSPKSTVYTVYDVFSYHKQMIKGNHNIVFLSGSNVFNQNGLRWFLDNIYPVIQEKFSDVKLIVGGSVCKVMPELKSIDCVESQGYIDDVNAFYSQGDVCINPCYQGTGLKIKTIESISYDKVTMVHPHSTQGIYDKDHAPLFSSDKAEDWVKFLADVWKSQDTIKAIKNENEKYLTAMEKLVSSEYDRFLRA